MITLSHTLAREYIQQMADGETLRAEARQALQQHLAECGECRAYAQEIKALHLTLSRAFRDRWEHQPLPQRASPLTLRPPARAWSPLAQMMVMVTMTFLVLSLLPKWSRLPAVPATLAPTETVSAPAVTYPRAEAVPDDGLENLASLETHASAQTMETQTDPVETDPYFLNDPDNRAARAQ
jgi:anti-sigma factor RsiW